MTATGLSVGYTAAHTAILKASQEAGLTGHDIRVLVAAWDCSAGRGQNSTTSDQLALALEDPAGSGVRRSLGVLRRAGLVVGGNKRGVRAPIRVTPKGDQLVQKVYYSRSALLWDIAAALKGTNGNAANHH